MYDRGFSHSSNVFVYPTMGKRHPAVTIAVGMVRCFNRSAPIHLLRLEIQPELTDFGWQILWQIDAFPIGSMYVIYGNIAVIHAELGLDPQK